MNDGKGWRGKYFAWGKATPPVGLGQIKKADGQKAVGFGFNYKLAPVQPLRVRERLKEIALENMDAVQEWEDCRVKMRDWRNCFVCPFKDCINNKPKITAKMNRDEVAFIERLLFPSIPEDESYKKSKAKYTEKNKEKIAQFQKEYDKAYRQKNKAIIDEKKRVYIEKNKDEVAQRKHDWYMKNREKELQKAKGRLEDKEKRERKKQIQHEWYLRKKEKEKKKKSEPTPPVKE